MTIQKEAQNNNNAQPKKTFNNIYRVHITFPTFLNNKQLMTSVINKKKTDL